MRSQRKIAITPPKHQKKLEETRYIFPSKAVIAIIGVCLLIIAGLIIDLTMGRMKVNDEKIRTYQALEVMISIDDFIHQKYNEISALKDPRTAAMDAEFPQLDYQYHYAKSLAEKYQAAKKFVEFIDSGHTYLQSLGYTKPDEDQRFDELVYQFNKIK